MAHLHHRSVVSELLLFFGVGFFRVDDPTPIPPMVMLPLDPKRKGDNVCWGELWLLFFDFVRGFAEEASGVVIGGGGKWCFGGRMRILNLHHSQCPCIYQLAWCRWFHWNIRPVRGALLMLLQYPFGVNWHTLHKRALSLNFYVLSSTKPTYPLRHPSI